MRCCAGGLAERSCLLKLRHTSRPPSHLPRGTPAEMRVQVRLPGRLSWLQLRLWRKPQHCGAWRGLRLCGKRLRLCCRRALRCSAGHGLGKLRLQLCGTGRQLRLWDKLLRLCRVAGRGLLYGSAGRGRSGCKTKVVLKKSAQEEVVARPK